MDFSWDDIEHIHPIWPKKHGQHPTIAIPSTQKNGENEEIPMLPGLAVLLGKASKSERFGWVVNPERVEYQLQRRPARRLIPTCSEYLGGPSSHGTAIVRSPRRAVCPRRRSGSGYGNQS